MSLHPLAFLSQNQKGAHNSADLLQIRDSNSCMTLCGCTTPGHINAVLSALLPGPGVAMGHLRHTAGAVPRAGSPQEVPAGSVSSHLPLRPQGLQDGRKPLLVLGLLTHT